MFGRLSVGLFGQNLFATMREWQMSHVVEKSCCPQQHPRLLDRHTDPIEGLLKLIL